MDGGELVEPGFGDGRVGRDLVGCGVGWGSAQLASRAKPETEGMEIMSRQEKSGPLLCPIPYRRRLRLDRRSVSPSSPQFILRDG